MIDFGWQVATSDSPSAGAVVGLLFTHTDYQLRSVVVRRGALAVREIVVPSEHVLSAEDGVVTLSITENEVEEYEDLRERRFVSPERDLEPPHDVDAPGVLIGTAPALFTGEPTNPATVGGTPLVVETVANVPDDCVAFWDGQLVLAPDGEPLGEVAHLLYREGQLDAVIVDSEGLFGSGKVVPIDLIAEFSVEEMGLSIDRATFEHLQDAPVA
ncbi:MAG: hypothetical protein M3P51_05295 [Chloroflexota bacterium]|nr:hypothetical protein [Chloroflexota bacterium]